MPALALGAMLALPQRGDACTRAVSLTPIEPRAVVAEADAAFVGTLVDVRPLSGEPSGFSGQFRVFTYTVEERIKGDLPERVGVISVGSTASCGLPASVGRRVALTVHRRDGAWHADLFSIYTPEYLRRGTLPLPRPTGSGQVLLVVGGHFGGGARSAALDSKGRVLAYGTGGGFVTSVSVCPGGRTSVELAGRSGGGVRIALRRLPSMRLTRETEIFPSGSGTTVVCRTASGSEVLVVARDSLGEGAESQLLRITPIGRRVLERAQGLGVFARGQKVLVSSSNELVMRDLLAGTRRLLRRIPSSLDGLSLSPDERYAAGFSGAELVVVDLADGTIRTRRRAGSFRGTAWTGSGSLVAWSGSGRQGGRLERFTATLRPLRPGIDWPAHATAILGTQVFGVDFDGTLLHRRADGRVRESGELFSPAVLTLAPLPQP